MGYLTSEQRDKHFKLLKSAKIRNQEIQVSMCAHDYESIRATQSYYEINPFGEELKTLIIFGIDEKTDEKHLASLLPKNGGIRQIHTDHYQIFYPTWFDAELAFNDLNNKCLNGIKLVSGFAFQRKMLKETYLNLVNEFNANKQLENTNILIDQPCTSSDDSSVYVKTEVLDDRLIAKQPKSTTCSVEKETISDKDKNARRCSMYIFDLPKNICEFELKNLSKDILNVSFDKK